MKLRKGMLVSVEFSDHVENGNRPIKFTVFGRIASITKTTISVDSWAYSNVKHKHDHNQTRFTIVRSAVHRIARLHEEEVFHS